MDKYYINKEDAVLVIIDIQERLVPVMNKKEGIIKNTNILVSMANTMDIPIVVTQQYTKGLGETVAEINGNLRDVKRIEKIDFTACINETMDYLKEIDRKSIIVAGIEAHVCVLQTVRDLLAQGYNVFLVSDGVGSRTEENYKNALEMMRDMGAVISNTESILFDLLKKAGTPEFKELSRLIK